jgi:hypothetical protein
VTALRSKDVLAGLLFAAFGTIALLVAQGYKLGTTMRMGPGYFPAVLGGILLLFGGFLVWRGLRRPEAIEGGWGWRPLALVTLSMLLFGFLLPRLGLVPAIAATLVVSAMAGREFRWKEALVLVAVLEAFAVLLFVGLLKLPFRLFLDHWWVLW